MRSVSIFYSFKKQLKKYFSAIRHRLNPQAEYIESKVDIINWLGKQYGYDSYLQISTYTTGGFYDQISDAIYTVKECLNYLPANGIFDDISEASLTKDHLIKLQTYEEALSEVKKSRSTFDIIFVDSFHSFEQTWQDLLVAVSLLSEQGIIVVHDCYPKKKKHTGDVWNEGIWLGQTYEAFIHFRAQHPRFESAVVNIDYGCGLIRRSQSPFNPLQIPPAMTLTEATVWEYFSEHAPNLLNLIDDKQFKQHYAPKQITAPTAGASAMSD